MPVTDCQCCESRDLQVFFELGKVPVHSCLLANNLEESLQTSRGDLQLAFCRNCGFIQNSAFDVNLMDYSQGYEDTQMCSGRFSEYLHELANDLIEKYSLKKKTVLEIGCGQGDFLKLICQSGAQKCIGYDPAYRGSTGSGAAVNPQISFHRKFYPDHTCGEDPDLIVCRHTLEHIPATREFLLALKKCIGSRTDTIVCFEVPDVGRVLEEDAFWDIYYEHCSYFTSGSLARLFRACGFAILDIRKVYSEQYLVIEAKLSDGDPERYFELEEDLENISSAVERFKENVIFKLRDWRDELNRIEQAGQRTAIWGAGSKAMGFLTDLRVKDEIGCVVDINPNKHGYYQIGTQQQIVAPDYLKEYRPDGVIIMNPVYQDEIQRDLNEMGLSPNVVVL